MKRTRKRAAARPFNGDARISAVGTCPHAPGTRLAQAFAVLRVRDSVRDFRLACRKAGVGAGALPYWVKRGSVTLRPFAGEIYLITHTPSGKGYVGQAFHKATGRIKAHLNDAKKGAGFLIHRVLRKHPLREFRFEVLHTNVSSARALDALEQKEVRERGTLAPGGFNLTKGGPARHGRGGGSTGEALRCIKGGIRPTGGPRTALGKAEGSVRQP